MDSFLPGLNKQIYKTFILALSMLATIVAACIYFDIDTHLVTRDVTAIAQIHPLSGILSNFGILLWCAAASVCFFSSALVDKADHRTFSFLLSSALLSTYLLLDDAFLIHEQLAPKYLGIDEKMVFSFILIAVISYLAVFYRIIQNTEYPRLIIALLFLSLSVAIDLLFESWLWKKIGHWEFLLEDGTKWIGISFWCSYYVNTSSLAIKGRQPKIS